MRDNSEPNFDSNDNQINNKTESVIQTPTLIEKEIEKRETEIEIPTNSNIPNTSNFNQNDQKTQNESNFKTLPLEKTLIPPKKNTKRKTNKRFSLMDAKKYAQQTTPTEKSDLGELDKIEELVKHGEKVIFPFFPFHKFNLVFFLTNSSNNNLPN